MEDNASYIETIAKIKTQQNEFDTLVTLILNNCKMNYDNKKLSLKTTADDVILEYIKAVRPDDYGNALSREKSI